MSPTTLPTARRASGLKGSQVLMMFGVFFGTIFAVNASLIYSALSTNTGLVANEPYRKGLHYNERIAAAERQAQLGWSDTATLDRNGALTVSLVDGQGKLVSGLKVRAVVGRPASNREDHAIALVEAAPGVYQAQLGTLEAGNWLVAYEAAEAAAAEPVYLARRRLWLKP